MENLISRIGFYSVKNDSRARKVDRYAASPHGGIDSETERNLHANYESPLRIRTLATARKAASISIRIARNCLQLH